MIIRAFSIRIDIRISLISEAIIGAPGAI